MPEHKPDALLRRLADGRLAGAYFLHGTEEYLKEEAVAAIVSAHLDPAARDFDLDQLRGDETSPEAFASILQTPPMMGAWRVVVLREAQAVATSARLRLAVESVFEQSVAGLALVLVARIPEKSSARIYQRLKQQATSAEFAPLSPDAVPGWLMERAGSAGVELDREAALGLATAVGTDLGSLLRELEKLVDYVGERARVTLEDVEAAVGTVPRVNRWQWIDQVAERRFTEARAGLPVLLDGRETGVGLLIGLGSHFLRLGVAVAGGARALDRELPKNQKWLSGRVLAQARRWSAPAVDATLDDLLRADRLLKSGSGDHEAMEELLLRLQMRSARSLRAS